MIQIFDVRTERKVFPPVLITIVDKNDPKHTQSPKVKKGEQSILPPPPPSPPAPPKVKKGEMSNIPPPPPPPSHEKIINSSSGFSDYMIKMERNNDAIYYKENKISASEAIAIYKKYGKIDIVTKRLHDNKFSVYDFEFTWNGQENKLIVDMSVWWQYYNIESFIDGID